MKAYVVKTFYNQLSLIDSAMYLFIKIYSPYKIGITNIRMGKDIFECWLAFKYIEYSNICPTSNAVLVHAINTTLEINISCIICTTKFLFCSKTLQAEEKIRELLLLRKHLEFHYV